MPPGAKKKTDAEKKAKGTFRASRGQPGASGEALTDLPPPDWLPDYAKAAWEVFRPDVEGRVLAAEIPMLEALACLNGRFRLGELAGKPMKSPELAQMRGLAKDFGLVPCERGRKPKKKEPEKENPFKDM